MVSHINCHRFTLPTPHIPQPQNHRTHRTNFQGVLNPFHNKTSHRHPQKPPRPTLTTTHSSINTVAAAAASPLQPSSQPDEFNVPGLDPPKKTRPSNSVFHRLLLHPLHNILALLWPPLASIELLRRLAVTIVSLLVIRAGHFLPAPGIRIDSVGVLPEMSFGNLLPSELPGNIFTLNITPLMSAYFALGIISIFPEVKRHMSNLREEGRAGREMINGYITTLFVIFAILESITATKAILANSISTTSPIPLSLKVSMGINLLAGAVICKYLVQCIDNWGLGDGTGVVIGAGVALGFIQNLKRNFLPVVLSSWGTAMAVAPQNLFLSFGCVFCLVAVVVKVQGAALNLPLVFYKPRKSSRQEMHPVLSMLSRDSNTALNTQAQFPMRLSPTGARQLLFANWWVGMFSTGGPLAFLKLGALLRNPWGFAAMVFVLESVSVGDATPKQMTDYLNNTDSGIKGLSPGIDTQRFLTSRRHQLKLLNAAFIACISLAARYLDTLCIALLGAPIDCLAILLLVSTVLGASRQVDALSRGPQVEKMIQSEYDVVESVRRQQR